MFRGIANFSSMLKQAGQLSGKLSGLSDELKTKRATGSAGAGLVEVEVNGLSQVLRVTLAPELIDRKDRELMEDLIPAAINQALAKAKDLHAEAMKNLAGDMNLPGLDEALAQLGGKE
ncbi:MAG TPA: YbaB/EbfC family nucleoid-associated protein [Pirellulales bacterium]|jgi:hypothetical protein|nr:YbaB/EbfC family nucleoid-associated protein [Pirellulales bacterium]